MSQDPDQATREEGENRSAPTAHVVYEAIRSEGEDELARPSAALAWSGLAAGLSMGFSFVAEALLRDHLAPASWRPLVTKLGYSVGFLIVVLGRQQLFTENTLTVILPLLQRKSVAALLNVLRLWAVVLLANLAGGLAFAWVAGRTGAFDESVRGTFHEIASEAMSAGFGLTLLRGIFAGWLIALMVWLLPFAEAARIFVIVILTYLIGIAHLPHVIAGSVELFYLAATGVKTWSDVLLSHLLPTLLGNVIGGTALVAALAHAQTVAGNQGADA